MHIINKFIVSLVTMEGVRFCVPHDFLQDVMVYLVMCQYFKFNILSYVILFVLEFGAPRLMIDIIIEQFDMNKNINEMYHDVINSFLRQCVIFMEHINQLMER